ncbi:MAG TPA: hypothetical protein VIX37_07975 [Candidatus Sulfotelmatobacter sp.]
MSEAKVIGATDYAIEMDGLTRRFGDFVAVDRVTLKIPKGQLLRIPGSGGCERSLKFQEVYRDSNSLLMLTASSTLPLMQSLNVSRFREV